MEETGITPRQFAERHRQRRPRPCSAPIALPCTSPMPGLTWLRCPGPAGCWAMPPTSCNNSECPSLPRVSGAVPRLQAPDKLRARQRRQHGRRALPGKLPAWSNFTGTELEADPCLRDSTWANSDRGATQVPAALARRWGLPAVRANIHGHLTQ